MHNSYTSLQNGPMMTHLYHPVNYPYILRRKSDFGEARSFFGYRKNCEYRVVFKNITQKAGNGRSTNIRLHKGPRLLKNRHNSYLNRKRSILKPKQRNQQYIIHFRQNEAILRRISGSAIHSISP